MEKLNARLLNSINGVLDEILDIATNNPAEMFSTESERLKSYHIELKKMGRHWKSSKACVAPSCNDQSIPASHSLQRNGPLSLIAEAQHVLTPKFNHSNGHLEMAKIGVGEASTFPGFCSNHEIMFSEFETAKTLHSPQHFGLQAFRAIAREVVSKRAQVHRLERIAANFKNVAKDQFLQRLLERIGKEEFAKFEIQFNGFEISGGAMSPLEKQLNQARQTLTDFEQRFLIPSFAEVTGSPEALWHFVISVEELLPVALSGTGNFLIADGSNTRDVRVFMTIWPTASKTFFSISSTLAERPYLEAYLDRMINKNGLAPVLTMAETWMVRGSDHWFITPTVWNNIPEPRQRKILRDICDVKFNIGEAYDSSIFDSIRTAMLNSPDIGKVAPKAVLHERLKMEPHVLNSAPHLVC